MSFALSAAVAAYVLFSTLVLYIGYVLVRGVIRGAGRLITRDSAALGTDARVRLLSLGGAVLLFGDALSATVRSTLLFFTTLFDQFPTNLAIAWRSASGACTEAENAECAARTWFSLLEVSTHSFVQALREAELSSLPVARLLLLLSSWALLGMILSAFLPPLPRPAPDPRPRRGGLSRLFRSRRDAGDDGTESLAGEVPPPVVQPQPVVARRSPAARRWSRRLRAVRRRITPVTTQNALFFVLLFIGAYLSIAAIGAIPDLQGEVEELQTPLSPGTLESRIANSKLTVPTELSGDPLGRLKELLCTHPELAADALCARPRADSVAGAAERGAPSAADGAGSAQPRPATTDTGAARIGAAVSGTKTDSIPATPAAAAAQNAQIKVGARARRERLDTVTVSGWQASAAARAVRALEEARERRRQDYATLVKERLEELESARAQARGAYEVMAAGRSRARVKEQYFYRLTEWHAGLTRRYRVQINTVRSEHDAADRALTLWSQQMRARLLNPPTTDAESLVPAGFEQEDPFGSLIDEAFMRASADPVPVERQSLNFPARPEAGYGMGPFAFVSGWLLNTESLPLALITGMLGFGLLGAAASTFVRDQLVSGGMQGRGPDQPLVKDLTGVVIRGGSAAIVVFLGVMGGLAVFSVNDNPRPNAYVLLFTCLAGAVFSDTVWKWAEAKLKSQLPDEDDADGEDASGTTTDPGGEPSPPATPDGEDGMDADGEDGDDAASGGSRPAETHVVPPADPPAPDAAHGKDGDEGEDAGRTGAEGPDGAVG
ncbi:MAG TPA: hypothetical protein VFT45_16570 [Longimicrobium sp.]|nr:hypothetical protein [Longimicrobium sp.]